MANKIVITTFFILLAFIFNQSFILAKSSQNIKKIDNFCKDLPKLTSDINKKIAQRESNINKKRNETLNRLSLNRSEMDAKIAEYRAQKNLKLTESFVRLKEKKATTDKQKQQIQTLEDIIDSVFSLRRLSINQANKDFRQGLDNLIAQKNSAIDSAINSYKDSIKLSFDKAVRNCASSTEPIIVRNNTDKDLQNIRDKFLEDQKNISQVSKLVNLLVKTRKQSIDMANSHFELEIKKAKQNFNNAFQ